MEEKSIEKNGCRPNLYRYAKNERAQDAFISWLIHWAAPEFKKTDPILHDCGVKFIDALYAKAAISSKSVINKPEEYSSIKIFNQEGHIDVLVILNNFSYAIIIEDKTGTKNSSTQLAEYLDFVSTDRNYSKIPRENILPIYLKTGDQSSYKNIQDNKYFEFLRIDLLRILRQGKACGIENHIFIDFLEHLEKIECAVKRYKNEPIDVWAKNNNRAWSGFFSEIKERMGDGNWEYVPNQTKGFMGFHWHSVEVDDIKLILQLEETKLCFKVNMKSKKSANSSSVRNTWHRRIIAEAKKEGRADLKIVKPGRFGSGQFMTVAVLDNYMQKDSNNIIDLDKTLNVLKRCETILDAAISANLNGKL